MKGTVIAQSFSILGKKNMFLLLQRKKLHLITLSAIYYVSVKDKVEKVIVGLFQRKPLLRSDADRQNGHNLRNTSDMR